MGICEKKYKSEPEARLHAYCHNPYEILKQIKKFEVNLYNQMLNVSPDIMAQAKNEFILKQQHDREKRIKHEDSLKKAAKEVAKTRKEKHLNKREEIINAEKEDLEIKKALEESLKETKEEAIKAEKEALEVEKALEESLRESKEKAMKEIIKQEELKKKK